MCSLLWLLIDRNILEDYPQMCILESLKQRCRDQEVGFTLVLMDQIAVTVTDGKLGDAGYGYFSWLLAPLLIPDSPVEYKYNHAHKVEELPPAAAAVTEDLAIKDSSAESWKGEYSSSRTVVSDEPSLVITEDTDDEAVVSGDLKWWGPLKRRDTFDAGLFLDVIFPMNSLHDVIGLMDKKGVLPQVTAIIQRKALKQSILSLLERVMLGGLQINQKIVTAYPQVILVRVQTPTVQSDSDITVLRHLEKLGCRLVNCPQAILNCINKFWTFQELAGHGIPLPDTFSYGGHDEFSKMIKAAESLGYPVVVKNTRGHQGKAVFLAQDKHHLLDISHLLQHSAPYLFQKYVKESHGKDVRVVIVGGHVIGSMLRCSTDGRMQSNCCLGGVGTSFPLSEQGKLLALQVSTILGMDICGIDLLLKDNGSFMVCEANANIGFTEFDQACKLDVGGIIADYAISLLPSRPSIEMPLLPTVSIPQDINKTKAHTSANIYTSDGSICNDSVSDVEEIRDSINVPKPCSPVLTDSIFSDVTK